MTEPPAPQAIYEPFLGRVEFHAAVDRLLACDGLELRVFDPDLSAMELNTLARVERLEAFITHSRVRKVFVVLHDIDHVTRYCPRMMTLITRYSHAVQVHRTHDNIRHLQDAFLVLDRSHYVRRPVARYMRGAIGIYDEIDAQAMRLRFGEIWSASYPAVSGTTSGLR